MSTAVEDNTQGFQPLTDRQEATVYAPDELWSDSFALKVAVQDFQKAESYRTQNADWRWRTANELYQAWVNQKYWEGTKIPRASIGVFVAFEQIESMLPKILGAIFADNPWMEADPLAGTTAEQARIWRDHLIDQMDKTQVREIFRRVIKDALMYGNGIMKLSWVLRQHEELEWIPTMRQSPPKNGGLPTYERILQKLKINRIENRPILERVALEDFYVDPNCAAPVIQGNAKYVAQRKLVTVEDLAQLRGLKEYKIPADDVLLDWSRSKTVTNGDATKGTTELFRMGSWYPAMDQTVDPGRKRIEVIEYWTEDRLVLVGNRVKALLNVPNNYGEIPYFGSFYADVPSRFYAMGVCDVVEGEQRLQQSVLNARLDELSLSIHRPMIKKLGVKTPTYALRSRPGQIWEAENPDKDYKFMDIPNITQSAYIETNESGNRVQKVVGQADLYSSGTAAPGGNSASRTATGVGAQVQAGGSRIQYLVETLEDTFIEPMLNMAVKLNHMFPPIGTTAADTVALSKVSISMRASARMQSRMALMQTFPLVLQTMANPALVQAMAQQGVTPNWLELMSILTDMTGYQKRADLIRPLTQQEQKQLGQPPVEEMIKMMMQKERIQGQAAIQQQRLASDNQIEQQHMAHDGLGQDNQVMAELAKALIQAHAVRNQGKTE